MSAPNATRVADRPNGAHAPAADDILPTAVAEKLAHLAETASSIDWAIGDSVIELAAELFPRYRKAEIIRAVATRTQLQPSAVRAREATARFWDEADRAEFDGLTYSHMRLAMRQPLPRSDLQHCLDSADDFNGQPMPYHAYAAMVKERKGTPDIDPHKLAGQAQAYLARALDCPNVPQATQAVWKKALDILELD